MWSLGKHQKETDRSWIITTRSLVLFLSLWWIHFMLFIYCRCWDLSAGNLKWIYQVPILAAVVVSTHLLCVPSCVKTNSVSVHLWHYSSFRRRLIMFVITPNCIIMFSIFRLILSYFWTSSEFWQLNCEKQMLEGVTRDNSTGTEPQFCAVICLICLIHSLFGVLVTHIPAVMVNPWINLLIAFAFWGRFSNGNSEWLFVPSQWWSLKYMFNIKMVLQRLLTYLLQKTVEVHIGADATLWCPLHRVQCHAIYRGVWNSLADPDALWDAVQFLPGKAGNGWDADLASSWTNLFGLNMLLPA